MDELENPSNCNEPPEEEEHIEHEIATIHMKSMTEDLLIDMDMLIGFYGTIQAIKHRKRKFK